MNVMQNRRSIRRFKETKISQEMITQMLKSAMQAPSAKNQQPWEFIVVDDVNKLKKMSTASQGSWPLEQAPLAIVAIMKPSDKSPHYRDQDLSAATQNILLEAHQLGLGAVWIGCYPLEERTSLIKEVLDIPSPYEPFSVLAIGHPNETRDLQERYDQTRVHLNRWSK